MNVRVKLFAIARDVVGQSEVELAFPGEPRVADLRAALAANYPSLAPALALSRFAVNADFAGDDTLLRATDEVALIPPVSGG
jgi:molybdopterin converting factor subunit 1